MRTRWRRERLGDGGEGGRECATKTVVYDFFGSMFTRGDAFCSHESLITTLHAMRDGFCSDSSIIVPLETCILLDRSKDIRDAFRVHTSLI